MEWFRNSNNLSINNTPNTTGLIKTNTGKPTNDVGKFGDYYYDTDAHLLYGPKSRTVNWGSEVGGKRVF
jgi:hypothetical protein